MIEVVVLLLVVAAVLVALRVRRFGGFSAAFSPKDKEQRDELVAAQKAMQTAVREREAHLAAPRRAAEETVSAYVSRVQEAEAALAQARDPGQGRRIAQLDTVALHEHVLWLSGQAIPLAGLQVAVQPTFNMVALVVQLPDGRRLSHPFSTELRTDQHGRQSRDYDDAQVQRLADSIHNAVVSDREFRAAQPGMVARAEAGLAAAQADTAEMSRALARLDAAQENAPGTDAALAAHERLMALENVWAARLAAGKPTRQLTG